jgi:hypothetical protein
MDLLNVTWVTLLMPSSHLPFSKHQGSVFEGCASQ